MTKIRIVKKINRDKWEQFLLTHPNNNPFQTPEMLDVLEKTKNYNFIFLVAKNSEDEIVGILLSQIQKDYKGLLGELTSRSIIWGGPLVLNNCPQITSLLLFEYSKIASKKAIYTQFRNLWTIQAKESFEENGFQYDEHLNILVDLSIGEEALWKAIKKSRKEGIRKAKRNDLIFEVINLENNIPVFYELLKNTFVSVKKPFPKIDFFIEIGNSFEKETVKLFQLKKDGIVIVSLLAFTYNRCIYAYYIGTNREHKYFVMRPIDLLYWETMRWGINNNMNTFDWMGAGKPDIEYGVRKFKLQYGGEMLTLGRFEKTHKTYLMKLGKFGLKLWKKLR